MGRFGVLNWDGRIVIMSIDTPVAEIDAEIATLRHP